MKDMKNKNNNISKKIIKLKKISITE